MWMLHVHVSARYRYNATLVRECPGSSRHEQGPLRGRYAAVAGSAAQSARNPHIVDAKALATLAPRPRPGTHVNIRVLPVGTCCSSIRGFPTALSTRRALHAKRTLDTYAHYPLACCGGRHILIDFAIEIANRKQTLAVARAADTSGRAVRDPVSSYLHDVSWRSRVLVCDRREVTSAVCELTPLRCRAGPQSRQHALELAGQERLEAPS